MGDLGIKVVKNGADVTSTDVRDIILSSKYSMFKYHSDTLGTVTFNGGDQHKYGTITHNLGYVPAHISYTVDPIEGANFMIPSIPYGVSGYDYAESQCGTTNLVIGIHLNTPYGQFTVPTDQIFHELDTGSVNVLVGNAGGNSYSSAVRFPSINLNKNQSIISASIEFTHQVSGTTNQNTKFHTFGIDEDNVGNVDTSKVTTTAVTVQEQSKTSGFFNFSTDVTEQVREIIARSGWTNGNNMGFMIFDNGSPSDAYIGGDNSSSANLTISTTSGSINYRYRGIIFKDKII